MHKLPLPYLGSVTFAIWEQERGEVGEIYPTLHFFVLRTLHLLECSTNGNVKKNIILTFGRLLRRNPNDKIIVLFLLRWAYNIINVTKWKICCAEFSDFATSIMLHSEFKGTVLTPDRRSVPDRSENCVFEFCGCCPQAGRAFLWHCPKKQRLVFFIGIVG